MLILFWLYDSLGCLILFVIIVTLLMVSTPSQKSESNWIISPNFGVKIKHIWNHLQWSLWQVIVLKVSQGPLLAHPGGFSQIQQSVASPKCVGAGWSHSLDYKSSSILSAIPLRFPRSLDRFRIEVQAATWLYLGIGNCKEQKCPSCERTQSREVHHQSTVQHTGS